MLSPVQMVKQVMCITYVFKINVFAQSVDKIMVFLLLRERTTSPLKA